MIAGDIWMKSIHLDLYVPLWLLRYPLFSKLYFQASTFNTNEMGQHCNEFGQLGGEYYEINRRSYRKQEQNLLIC